MKKITKFILTSFISLLISSFLFFSLLLYFFIPKNQTDISVEKTQSLVPYSFSSLPTADTTILLKLENCPTDFLIKISASSLNLSVTCAETAYSDENSYHIFFNLNGFENTVNFLGGIEIETPYGLPSPAKNKKIIAKDEKMLVFGASLGEILTMEPNPPKERKSYYCYVLRELCLEFLKDCTTDDYKFLNKNCETDISYTKFYDNYKTLQKVK